MSAIISNDVQMKEILKATGFDCPEGMLGKTFSEVTGGGKWYCYKDKNAPYNPIYFKEEIPDVDTPLITEESGSNRLLIHTTLWERYFHNVSVTCNDGTLKVTFKNPQSSSPATFTRYRSPDDDLNLV